MKYVYKVVAAAMAFSIALTTFFGTIFYYSVQSTALQLVIAYAQSQEMQSAADIMENRDSVPDTLNGTISICNIVSIMPSFTQFIDEAKKQLIDENIETEESSTATTTTYDFSSVKTNAIVVLVLLGVIAIIALVTAVISLVAKNNRKVIYGSIVGFGFSMILKFAFDSLVTPFLDGTISSTDIISNKWAPLLGKIETLSLSGSFWLIPALFVCIIVWTFIYNFTLPEEEKAERKRMLGEYNEQ